MACQCPIWMYGRTGDSFYPRQSTGFTDLADAEAQRAYQVALSKDETVHGPRIGECIEKHLTSLQVGDKTRGHHKLLLSRLKAYCERHSVFFMSDLSVDLLESFKVGGLPAELANTTRSTAVAKLRCFLRTAYRRGWLAEPLVEKVLTFRATHEQKEPYSDAEVKKILEEAERLNGGRVGYSAHPKTFRLLLELMLETGMRVGDTVRYDPGAARRGERMWVYTFVMQKRKQTERAKQVDAFITDGLKTAIDNCAWLSKERPFMFGSSGNPNRLGTEVWKRMQTIGARCGVADCRPHRLRDTFAVRKLLSGVPLDDVSRLLGHSSIQVTEMYYAKWVPGRIRRLEQLVSETLVNA